MRKTISLPFDGIKNAVRDVTIALRNAPLYLLCMVVSLAIESLTWAGAFAIDTGVMHLPFGDVPTAWAEAITSSAFTLLALVLTGAAASQRNDPRREQRPRARHTQAIAIAALIGPVFYAGSCLGYQHQLAGWQAFHGSQAERSLIDLSHGVAADGRGVDSMVMQSAGQELLDKGVRPTQPDLDHLVPALAWIAFLLGANMASARFGWQAKPETDEETLARINSARAKQAVATRKANQQTVRAVG